MTLSRHELESELAALDNAVAQLLIDHEDPADFWPAFAGMADTIVDAAGPDDADWALEQVDAIIKVRGLAKDAG